MSYIELQGTNYHKGKYYFCDKENKVYKKVLSELVPFFIMNLVRVF
ncbi:cobyric acid synthase CobQ, putative [Thermoanaerobacter ethanolicus JW 200]|nr:cobyric acid synthase CobQ, putative [Thermoanaerobacter ethanolicus JW 200]